MAQPPQTGVAVTWQVPPRFRDHPDVVKVIDNLPAGMATAIVAGYCDKNYLMILRRLGDRRIKYAEVSLPPREARHLAAMLEMGADAAEEWKAQHPRSSSEE